MKIGDLVQRKNISSWRSKFSSRRELGLILSRRMSGKNPVHACITVYYPASGKTWEIAESLMEVVSESR